MAAPSVVLPHHDTPGESTMVSPATARLTFILSLVAAGLALAAAGITWSRSGKVEWTLIAAAAFLVVFGLGARARGRSAGL
jgi:sulfite exporter TauE/SafE